MKTLSRRWGVLLVASCLGMAGRAAEDPATGAPPPPGEAASEVAEATTPTVPTSEASVEVGQESKRVYQPRHAGGAATQDIVRMHQNGVSTEVMLAYVAYSGRAFYVPASEVVELTRVGVPSAVIVAMLKQGATSGSTGVVVPAEPATAVPSAAPATTTVAVAAPAVATPAPAVSTEPVWVTGTPPSSVTYVEVPTGIHVEPTWGCGAGWGLGIGGWPRATWHPRYGSARYNYSYPYPSHRGSRYVPDSRHFPLHGSGPRAVASVQVGVDILP